MENSQNNIGYFPQMPVGDKHLSAELNSDFSLPDYQPEIRRLLSTRATILPPSEYADNGRSSFEGEVIYKILYLGADGKLYSAHLSDKYSFEMPLEFNSHSVNTDELTLVPFCKSENVSTRVLGPRKLNVRAKLHFHTLALSPALYSPSVLGAYNGASLENLVYEEPTLSIKKSNSEPIVLTDFIALDSPLDDMRIVDVSSGISISECIPSNDKVNVRGELVLKMLYCNDAQSDYPLSLTRKIPILSTVDCEGVSSTYDCSASGSVIDEQLNIDESGVKLEVSVVLCVRAQKNEVVPYVSDAYSTERASESKNIDFPLLHAVKCTNGNLTQNEVFSLEEIKLLPDARIVDVITRPNINELKWENGRISLLGACEYQVIYCLEGEYSSRELTSPLKYELDSRSSVPNTSILKWSVDATASNSRARNDGERLFIDSELSFCVLLHEEAKISVLDEMVLGERLENSAGDLLLCYPDKEATLWSIAKKYNVPQRRIKTQNSIPDGETRIKKKFLII